MSLVTQLRGAYRLGGPAKSAPSGTGPGNIALSSEASSRQSWLEEARRLVPGEALAGYLAFQPLTRAAQEPANVKVVLGLVFLIVTVALRWLGTQDPKAAKPAETTQFAVVVLSGMCFVGLAYATGGQLWWHAPFPDQELYGQIAAFATGAIGSVLLRVLTGPAASDAPRG